MIECPPEIKEIIDTLQPPLIDGRIATCHEVLAINRIVPIVHSILAASIEAKEEVTEEQRVQLILFMTSKHMDAQRGLNYWQSVIVEQALLGIPPIICTVKDGKLWVESEKAPA